MYRSKKMNLLISRFLTNQGCYEYCVHQDGVVITREAFGLPPKEGFLWSWNEVCNYVWYTTHETQVTVTVTYA
jgi:hypothetical protein